MWYRKGFKPWMLVLFTVLTLLLGLCATSTRAHKGGAAAKTTIYYWKIDGSDLNSMLSDGSSVIQPLIDYSDLDGSSPGPVYEIGPHPSYGKPGGKRWFVSMAGEWVGPVWKQWIIFRSDAGDKPALIPIPSDLDNDSLYASTSSPMTVRWVPGTGDTQISLISHNSVTGESGIFTLPVTYDANGIPSTPTDPGTATLKLATSDYVTSIDGVLNAISVVGEYDWNATGTAICFRPIGLSGNPLSDGLYTYTITTAPAANLSSALFSGPTAGFSWGSTDKIAYVNSPAGGSQSIWTMASDGTSQTKIVASAKNTGYTYTQWSPDGNKVLFRYWYSTGRFKATIEFHTVASTGGTQTNLGAANAQPVGWRP